MTDLPAAGPAIDRGSYWPYELSKGVARCRLCEAPFYPRLTGDRTLCRLCELMLEALR